MGQTLENGVYLPSEGERNCYAGLKTNWEILDQKVADVTALQQAVAGVLHREIVESLPTTDIDPNTIYMILSGTSATENVYNEYMYVNNAWELIGTSATDLTNYYTKAEVDGKLLLKANASDLTLHTGDTTIHVTTADKNKWNNQTYVFRYSSTALVASSTNSNSLLDNTDNLKVGDKVIDSSGVLFSITAIDTQNSTFSIGTALVDLLSSADVGDVALSNNYNDLDNLPTIPTVNDAVLTIQKNGVNVQTFTANASSDVTCNITVPTKTSELTNDSGFLTSHQSLSSCVKNVVTNNQTIKSTAITRGTAPSSTQTFGIPFSDNNNKYIGNIYGLFATDMSIFVGLYAYKGSTTANSDNVSVRVGYDASGNAYTYAPTPATTDNSTQIATTAFVKAQGYLTSHQSLANYVTTNTDQTISGVKSFSDNISTKKIISNVAQLQINARSSADSVAVIAGTNASDGSGIWLYGKDNATGSDCRIQIYNTAKSRFERVDLVNSQFLPSPSGELDCGGTSNKWKSFNGLEPSSLSLPSDRSARIDISSYFTNTGTGNTNDYSVPANGYIFLNLLNAFAVICYSIDGTNNVNYAQSYFRQVDGQIYILFPVRKNDVFRTLWTSNGGTITVTGAHFIPCQGNV